MTKAKKEPKKAKEPKTNPGFQKRLKDILIKDFNNNKSRLAKAIGVSVSGMGNYLNDGRVAEWDILLKISETCNKSTDWLLTGEERFVQKAPPNITFQSTGKLKAFHEDFAKDNYIPVRLLKDSAAAGQPSEINENDTDGYCVIFADKKWMPGNPENYTCVHIKGKSMFPVLDDGDIVAIDHNQKNPKKLDKKMVAFRKNGGVTIKWLKLTDNGNVLGLPENRDEVDAIVNLEGNEIENGIIGRVAWFWAKR
jgi:phage repressor protein C with HTH and peptisase S24 domain